MIELLDVRFWQQGTWGWNKVTQSSERIYFVKQKSFVGGKHCQGQKQETLVFEEDKEHNFPWISSYRLHCLLEEMIDRYAPLQSRS